ncbi:MAG: NTP transferase domain-containing protein [Sphingomonadales bacterium]
MTTASVAALVLAGRRAPGTDPLELGDVPHKAVLPIHGQAMISYVVSALDGAKDINALAISAPPDVQDDLTKVLGDRTFVPAHSSPARSVEAALTQLEADYILVTSCDHPLLTADMVNEFLSLGLAAKMDVSVGCVERSVFLARFPTAKRTFVRLSDFCFSGANLFLFRPSRTRDLLRFWRALEDKRKQPVAMARQIGLGTALRYQVGRLSTAQLLRQIKDKTGARATFIPLDDPLAAIDVDKTSDVELVTALLKP